MKCDNMIVSYDFKKIKWIVQKCKKIMEFVQPEKEGKELYE